MRRRLVLPSVIPRGNSTNDKKNANCPRLARVAKDVLAAKLTPTLKAEIAKFFEGLFRCWPEVSQFGDRISVIWTEKAYGTQYVGKAEMKKYRFVSDDYEYYNENFDGPRRTKYGTDHFSSGEKQRIIAFCKQHKIPNLTIQWGTD